MQLVEETANTVKKKIATLENLICEEKRGGVKGAKSQMRGVLPVKKKIIIKWPIKII